MNLNKYSTKFKERGSCKLMNLRNIFTFTNKTKRLAKEVKKRPLPQHIAIIMDGNGRWAQQKELPREVGHRYGSEALKDIVEISVKIGIQYLTLFAFSTENWNRPDKEIEALMDLMIEYFQKELDDLVDNNIKLTVLGDIKKFPIHVQEEINYALDRTQGNNGLKLNIALNYGGRCDIVRATKNIVKDIQSGLLSIDDIDEEMFSEYLYTKTMPDPDLLIRTSGEYRISNFLLYQLAYTELWFSKPKLLWPDFSQRDFLRAILDYQARERRFGGLK